MSATEVVHSLDEWKRNIIEIEEMILDVNEKSIDSLVSKIREEVKSIDFIFKFIEYAMKIRPRNIKNLLELYAKLNRIHKYKMHKYILNDIKILLFSKGIIKETEIISKSRTAEDVINIFPDHSIERAIIEDDFKTFLDIIVDPNFDPNQKVIIKRGSLLFFAIITDSWYAKDQIEISLMQLMALFGAQKCLKIAIANENFDESNTDIFAIYGGNCEIIHILEHRNHSFDKCYNASIMFHRYRISDWLLNNYKCESIALQHTLKFFNDREYFRLLNSQTEISKITLGESLIYASKVSHLSVIVDLLDNYGVDVNYIDAYERTALSFCAENSFFEVLQLLVEKYKARVDQKSENGWTPLHWAARCGDIQTVKYLVKKCGSDPNIKDYYGESSIHFAAYGENLQVLKFFIEKCGVDPNETDFNDQTPLHVASSGDSLSCVEYLVEKCSADVTKKDTSSHTPLHVATIHKRYQIIKYFVEKCKSDIEQKDWRGLTPLLIAASNGSLEIVRYFVEKCSADLKAKSNSGNTILHFAAEEGRLQIVKYLVEDCKMQVNQLNENRKTPLDIAKDESIIEYLSKYL